MCEWCVSSYGSRKGKSSLLFTEGSHEQSPIPAAGERRERGRRLRSGRHPFSRLSFFPISTHTDLSKTCFSEARTQKARCTTRPPAPGVGACMYYLYAGVLRFYVSMKHRQCEREPGPDMLSVNATSAVVPFCMLW